MRGRGSSIGIGSSIGVRGGCGGGVREEGIAVGDTDATPDPAVERRAGDHAPLRLRRLTWR